MSAKLVYSIRILVGALSYSRAANESYFVEYFVIINTKASKIATCTTNVFETLSMVTSTNLCLLINFTCLAISIVFPIMYFVQKSFLVLNVTSALLTDKKYI